METGDQPHADEPRPPAPSRPLAPRRTVTHVRGFGLRPGSSLLGLGVRVRWVTGLVLALSAFTSWYSGQSNEGPTLSVTGWNSGTLGKLVFLIGLAVIALSLVRTLAIQFPPSVPEPLVVVALGALATIFVLIRLISIPASLVGTSGRSIGIWISLFSALAVIASGLLQASEEL